MNPLQAIIPELKTGNEPASLHNQSLEWNIQDFWKWSFSDLISNASRGVFAEFIVRQALELKTPLVRNEWDAYDLTTSEGLKIEIKSSAYIQSWAQKEYSKISFSIKPSRAYDYSTGTFEKEIKRHADIYIFCLLAHKDQETVSPLQLDQWEFYVVPTHILNKEFKDRKQLSLSALQEICDPINYSEIKARLFEITD